MFGLNFESGVEDEPNMSRHMINTKELHSANFTNFA